MKVFRIGTIGRIFKRSMREESDPANELAIAQQIEAHVAVNASFDERAAPLSEAVRHYLTAASGSIPGSTTWIEATFHAGCLLAGENSIRDLPRAVALLESVVARTQAYHLAYYYLAEAFVMLKDFDRAESLLRDALALDPEQDGIRAVLRHLPIDRVHEAQKHGDHSGVIDAVNRIAPDERGAEAWMLLGDALAESGDPTAATAWRHAMLLEPLKGMRRRFASLDLPFPGDFEYE